AGDAADREGPPPAGRHGHRAPEGFPDAPGRRRARELRERLSRLPGEPGHRLSTAGRRGRGERSPRRARGGRDRPDDAHARLRGRLPVKPRARAVLFALGLAASLAVAARVYKGSPSAWPPLPWALSIVPFLLSVRSGGPARRVRASSAALLAFAAVLPVLVRVANLDGDRMHTDEFLTGYFSLHHDFVKTSFFAPVPEWYEWQGQFPSPFFL